MDQGGKSGYSATGPGCFVGQLPAWYAIALISSRVVALGVLVPSSRSYPAPARSGYSVVSNLTEFPLQSSSSRLVSCQWSGESMLGTRRTGRGLGRTDGLVLGGVPSIIASSTRIRPQLRPAPTTSRTSSTPITACFNRMTLSNLSFYIRDARDGLLIDTNIVQFCYRIDVYPSYSSTTVPTMTLLIRH